MIRLRDDDVLMRRKEWKGKEFFQFQKVHELLCQAPNSIIHVGAILSREIEEFPEAIKYLRKETEAGRFLPEVHGLMHIDYALLRPNEIISHLGMVKVFIQDHFNYTPTVWYTPWGAGADERGSHLVKSARDAGFTMVTCENLTNPSMFLQNPSEDVEVFHHWWEPIAPLEELVRNIQ